MFISYNMLNASFKMLNKIISVGKDKEYIHDVDDASFFIRKNSSDVFVVYEVWKRKLYNIGIKKNDTVIDVGANIGAFTTFAAKKSIDGNVFSFEPEKSNFRQLQKNVRLNKLKNVVIYNLGVNKSKGLAQLFVSNNNGASHSLCNSGTNEIQTIHCITLADIFDKCNIDNIDVLKLDVEGAEYDILFSTPVKIFRKIDRIILEFHDNINLKYNYKGLISFLENTDFKVTMLSPNWFIKICGIGMLKAERAV